MAYHKNTVSLEKMLLKFLGEPDPIAIVNIKVIHWPSKTDPLALV